MRQNYVASPDQSDALLCETHSKLGDRTRCRDCTEVTGLENPSCDISQFCEKKNKMYMSAAFFFLSLNPPLLKFVYLLKNVRGISVLCV